MSGNSDRLTTDERQTVIEALKLLVGLKAKLEALLKR